MGSNMSAPRLDKAIFERNEGLTEKEIEDQSWV